MTKIAKIIIGIIVIVVIAIIGLKFYKKSGGQVESSKEPIRIGFIAPLTGDVAAYGGDEKKAAELAVEEINNGGGINGRKLEIIYEDGKCNGKDAVTSAQKLIDVDKVKVILGGACSGETLAIAPVAEQNKVIVFSAFASSPDITNAGDYIFRNAPSDTDIAKGYANFIVNKSGYKKIAIISENTDYTGGVRKVFNDAVKNLGGTIVADEVYKQGERDFRANLLKIKSSGAEAIFINPQSGTTGSLIVKQIGALAMKQPMFSVFFFAGKDVRDAAGAAANGLVFFDVVGLTGEKGKAFTEKFKSRFEKIVGNDYDIGARYDSVFITANALRKCGEDTSCIKDYFYNMDWYDGVIGKYKFDSNGDMTGIEPLTPKIIKNGEVELYGK